MTTFYCYTTQQVTSFPLRTFVVDAVATLDETPGLHGLVPQALWI
eukprot:SAG11_NODE_267_length_11457_cov_14.773728_4_plen_45_part_00